MSSCLEAIGINSGEERVGYGKMVDGEAPGKGKFKQLPLTVVLPFSPAHAMEIFDWCFWGAIFAGWTISYFYNPTSIYDNNITRTFQVLNVCVGFDFLPARPFVMYIFFLGWPLFAFGIWGRWLKISHGKGGYKKLRKALLLVAMLLTATFVLCLAVPPFNDLQWRVHVGCFGTALLGWSMFKVLGIIEFFYFDGHGGFYDEDHDGKQDTNAVVYIVTLTLHSAIMIGGALLMLYRAFTFPTDKFVSVINDMTIPAEYEHSSVQVHGGFKGLILDAKLVYADGTEKPIEFDWTGSLLVLATMIALPLQAWTIPFKLKYFKPVST